MQNQKGFSIALPILIIAAIVIIGGTGYAWYNKKMKEKGNINIATNNLPTITLPDQNQGSNQNATTAPQVAPVVEVVKDCGTDINYKKFDCFINASKNCVLAKIVSKAELNLFGVIAEGSTFFEIKGWEENKCVFYIKPISSKVTYSPEIIQKLLAGGATIEQIKQQEQETSKVAQSVVGRDGICKFIKTGDLTALLTQWKGGSFSSNDFKGFDCKGEYFGQGEQRANTSKTITNEECNSQKGYTTAVADTGTACFKNQIDLGTIVGALKMNGKYPQCCINLK